MFLLFLLALEDTPNSIDISWITGTLSLLKDLGFAGFLGWIVVYDRPRQEDLHRLERDSWRGYIEKRDEEYNSLLSKSIETMTMINSSIADLEKEIERLKQ